MKYYAQVAALFFLALSFTIAQAASGQPSAQPTEASGVQQAEKPPHVDAEPNPADRQLENTIMDDLKQDPHMAYSKVSVHVTYKEVLLTGTVLTKTAKDQAAQIAGEHAAKRKITNRIKVNSNLHPGPGF
jgi:osmotically-inducible protein OsmY